MQIQERLQSVIKILSTYINQRIHIGLWLSLTCFLMLYSIPVFSVSGHLIVLFVFLFGLLIIFRLYDDLQQTRYDTGKPNRDYTDPIIGKSLGYTFVILWVLLTGIAFGIKMESGLWLLGFTVLNHFVYWLLIANKTAAAFLPLLKYPFVYCLLHAMILSDTHYTQLYEALALFVAFVTFESMEDETFVLPVGDTKLFRLLSFGFLFLGHLKFNIGICGVALLLASVASTHFMKKIAPYLFLLFLLMFKLIIHYDLLSLR